MILAHLQTLLAMLSELEEQEDKSHFKPKILTIHISLSGCEPEVWRRFEVDNRLSLAGLHHVIQAVMGWDDCHLHSFEIRKRVFREPSEDGFLGFRDADEESEYDYFLGELLKRKGQKFRYVYDFGGHCAHHCVIEQTRDAGDEEIPPKALDGAGACPPENCGGVFGYANMLEAVADPHNELHGSLEECLGKFEPHHVDLASVNSRLERMCAGSAGDFEAE